MDCSSSFSLLLSKYHSYIWGVRLDFGLELRRRWMKRKERAIAVQMARKSEIPISLTFPRLEVFFCLIFEYLALGRISMLTATTMVWREGRLPNAGPHSVQLLLLLFNDAWLGRVEELLEAFGLMHDWEKQRNDETSFIDVCITTAMFFGLFDAYSASIYFPFVLTTHFELGRSIYLYFLRSGQIFVVRATRCIIVQSCFV